MTSVNLATLWHWQKNIRIAQSYLMWIREKFKTWGRRVGSIRLSRSLTLVST